MKEVRFAKSDIRVAGGNGDSMLLLGRAASFGVEAELPNFNEVIAPTAFDHSLRCMDEDDPDYDPDFDVQCNYNHQSDSLPLGRCQNKTLELHCDQRGLNFRCHLNSKIASHRDLHEAVKSGLVNSCSFAFEVPPGGDDWQNTIGDDSDRCYVLRTLKNVRLHDVSLVNAPAYKMTSVSARGKLEPYSPAQIRAIQTRLAATFRNRPGEPYTESELAEIRERLSRMV